MTHADQILSALKKGQKLTPLDALRRFGCFRLGARIHELRSKGYAIETLRFPEVPYATYRMKRRRAA